MPPIDERFKIYVEQLRDVSAAPLDEAFSCDFLAIDEGELSFRDPLKVKGEVYLAGDELILHLNLSVVYVVPCTVCNTPVEVEILLPNCYHAIPLKEIPHGIFLMNDLLREEILLETRSFAECNNGHCPHRPEIAPYLKHHQEEQKSPFSQLDKEDFIA